MITMRNLHNNPSISKQSMSESYEHLEQQLPIKNSTGRLSNDLTQFPVHIKKQYQLQEKVVKSKRGTGQNSHR
jgi:hypothetical protein